MVIRSVGRHFFNRHFKCLNLLTFDKLGDVDIDPETKSGDGASWYPIQKVFNFGIDITF